MISARDYTLAPEAIRDLQNIYMYIADTNPPAAKRLVDGIAGKIRSAALSGFTGAPRDELRSGLRVLIYRDRCIYFRVSDSHMTVLRILHGRQETYTDDFPESEI